MPADPASVAAQFWAKSTPHGDYLPLDVHMRDAGAVAGRLWDVALTDRQRAWWSRAAGLPEFAVRAWVVFLAAAHDIGKANPGFQYLLEDLAHRVLDPALTRPRVERMRHDVVGGAIVVEWLMGKGVGRRHAERIVATLSGHHSFPRPRRELADARYGVLAPLTDWAPHYLAALDALADWSGVEPDRPPTDASDAGIVALAGLVSVADWIASDADRFVPTAGAREDSHILAHRAVEVDAWRPLANPRAGSFRDVFGFVPRPTQAAMARVGESALRDPALVLIEDRTGSGKTEAALYAALAGLRAGARGLFVGLPTRATATQVHARVERFVNVVWEEETRRPRLLHGGVHLTPDEPQPADVARDVREVDDSEAAQWFAQTRRGLLTPFAVGTVDQALLAVLTARHYPVRLWGLQGKVVVLDEVHAYDTYTGLLLERLVAWLAALDCTVVLLSATLPADRRRTLAAAFREALGSPDADDDAATAYGYPRVTVASADGVVVHEIADDRPGREVDLEWSPVVHDDDGVARLAVEHVHDGGCVAVVCSTVDSAQRRYRGLRRIVDPDVVLRLLHARMRPVEREPIERELLGALGPSGDRESRPRRFIFVATQVIEQSLDLDFDAMISDLAPIDLLIQRAGRVHRHARPRRPARHRRPRLTVLDTPGSDASRHLPRDAAAVYVETVLVRTRIALRDVASLREPDDLDRLIGEVYDIEPPSRATAEERAHVRRLDELARNRARKLGGWADEAAVPASGGDDPPWEARGTPLMDPDTPRAYGENSAATRWSDRPSVSFVILRPEELPDARRRPDRSESVELLRRAVAISQQQVVQPALRALDELRPKAWQRNGRLRHHLLVELDQAGRALPVPTEADERVALPLALDPIEGVVISGGRGVQPGG